MLFRYSSTKMPKLFENSGYPDQTPHSVASDLGLHCLSITLLRGGVGVSRLKWVILRQLFPKCSLGSFKIHFQETI